MKYKNMTSVEYIRDGRTMQKETCPTCRCWSLAKKPDTDETPVCVNLHCTASPWHSR